MEEEEHSEDEFDSQEDLYVEFNTQDYEFIQRICLQTDQFKEYLFEIMYKDWQEQDIDQNQNFDEKQKALIKEFLRKTPQYKICAESMIKDEEPKLQQFNDIQLKLIDHWNNDIDEEVQDFILNEEEINSKDFKKLNKEQQLYIKTFRDQPKEFQDFLLNDDEENEDDGEGSEWESENSFKEDLGVGDLSEQDLKYIEEWKKQSDQLQNYIIEKKSNLSKYNFSEEEKQFIKNFKNQSREIKHFVGYDYIEF